MELPHSINVQSASIARNYKTQSLSPQDLSMYASIFIPYGTMEYLMRPSVKQERCANILTHHGGRDQDQKVIHERFSGFLLTWNWMAFP